MRSSGRALVALAALGVVMAVAAGAIILTSGHMSSRGTWAVYNAALGGSFVGTGLYAWWRRPDNRSGALMTWVGFLWFVSPLAFSNNAAIFTLGEFTSPLPIAALAHLVLALPEGRLESQFHRRLIAFAYLNATLLQLPDVVVSSPCDACPRNLLLISRDDGFAAHWSSFVNFVAIGTISVVTVELVRRVRRARRRDRDLYAPIIYAGTATLVAFGCLFVPTLFGFAESPTLRYAAYAVFVTVPYAYLVGLVRGRLSSAASVAELVEALGRADDRRASLRDSIAEALGDSSLSIAYWIPEAQAYVDADGQPVELPAPESGRMATPIERAGAPLAVVIHDATLGEERDLVRAVGGAASLTLENERLSAELRARIEELRASRARIVRAGDEERRRLERDLHDGAQQRLVALALNLRLARDSADLEEMRILTDEAIAELTEATAELRELARGIHPAVLTDRGLNAAVNALAGRARVPVEVHDVPQERLAPAVESTVYFVVAEALTNVTRYAHASHAEVGFERENGTLIVEVRDDGVGGADPANGSGLRGLADRVATVDGRLRVTGAPGAGTVVRAEIPCAP